MDKVWEILNREWGKAVNICGSYIISANIQHFLDQMNYSLTQKDMANTETQYSNLTHLNPFVELHLKFPNPNLAY